jgi:hypothetical protein
MRLWIGARKHELSIAHQALALRGDVVASALYQAPRATTLRACGRRVTEAANRTAPREEAREVTMTPILHHEQRPSEP